MGIIRSSSAPPYRHWLHSCYISSPMHYMMFASHQDSLVFAQWILICIISVTTNVALCRPINFALIIALASSHVNLFTICWSYASFHSFNVGHIQQSRCGPVILAGFRRTVLCIVVYKTRANGISHRVRIDASGEHVRRVERGLCPASYYRHQVLYGFALVGTRRGDANDCGGEGHRSEPSRSSLSVVGFEPRGPDRMLAAAAAAGGAYRDQVAMPASCSTCSVRCLSTTLPFPARRGCALRSCSRGGQELEVERRRYDTLRLTVQCLIGTPIFCRLYSRSNVGLPTYCYVSVYFISS